MSVPTLGYWEAQGIAQPIRLLLAFAGVIFNDKHYKIGLDGNKQDWLNEKFTLGLDFPNLPYYMDGQVKLTHSLAILHYLSRRHGLVATNEQAIQRQDMLEQQLMDDRADLTRVLFDKQNFAAKKVKYLSETLPPQLIALSKFLGTTSQWFTGSELNYVDFMAYNLLNWLRLFTPDSVAKHQNLVQFLTRFESLPQIKSYMASPGYMAWPLTNPTAAWGYYK